MTTQKAQPTPGPWEVLEPTTFHGYAIAPKGKLPTLASVERCGQEISVHVYNFPGETEANARLIAAAPELAEHLETICKLVDACQLYGPADVLRSQIRAAQQTLAMLHDGVTP